MSDDKYKKAAENLFNNVKPTTPQSGEYRKDSADIPVRNISDGIIKEDSIPVPSHPPIERKSFGLMSVQSSLDELPKK